MCISVNNIVRTCLGVTTQRRGAILGSRSKKFVKHRLNAIAAISPFVIGQNCFTNIELVACLFFMYSGDV